MMATKFQSTPPVWGATGLLDELRDTLDISIHAPRVGGDAKSVIQLAA